MPIFHYQAIDTAGKRRKGFVEANSEKEAKEKLRDQGVMVTKLLQKGGLSFGQNFNSEALYNFTILFSQLVSAGVPLYESLLLIEEQYRGEKTHRVILSLCEQVKAGTFLSEAMASFPGSFDKLYRSMITAGEAAGALPIVLDRLSALLQRQVKLKKQMTTALIYPAVLAGFALIVISLLIGFVIPSLEGIFEGRQINNFTSFVLNSSHFLRAYWWILLPALGGLIGYLVYWLKTPVGKGWSERQLLRLPMTRTLLVQSAMARFCRTMATLQQGGVSMIDSLRMARETMHNQTLEEEIAKAEGKIIEGSSLSQELARSKWVPHLVPRMVAVGEESGHLVEMLSRVAEMYEDEMEKTLNRVVALAQPVILIVMGVIIGSVIVAVLIPLTDISSFTQG